MKTNKKVLTLVQFAMLLAIEIVVCFTPLGSLPIGPLVATLSSVPVIITAILLGTKFGALMGLFAGTFSFIVWTFMPPSPFLAFVFTPFYSLGKIHGNFWSLVICFVPRILIGVVAGLVFRALSKRGGKVIPYVLSGIAGSMTTTILVLGGIYVFFGRAYAGALGIGYELLLGALGLTVVTNGLLEAAICAVAAFAVCRPLRKYHMLNRS